MKSIYQNLRFLMILALSAVVFSSCSEDEVEPVEPTADYSYETDQRTVTFTNTSENAESFNWNFGDGETSTEENPTHTYSDNGTYTVKLTAVNEGGHDLDRKEVIVKAPVSAATADFSFEADGQTVTFANASENAASYEWEFGDNNTSTEENPVHMFPAAGTYPVVLTVMDEDGNEVRKRQQISVEKTIPPAIPEFTFEVDGVAVSFTNESENAVGYVWDFGDGNTSTEENPNHSYEQSGTYDVTLTGIGEDGKEVDMTKEVSVQWPDPVPEFSYVADGLVLSTTNSSEEAVSYSWDFGDGSTSTEENPVHTYAAPGTYTVVLTAVGGDGTEIEATEVVEAQPYPVDPASQTIVFVSDNSDDDLQIAWLEEQGFNVTVFYDDALSTAPQADIDMLNAADLVIIARGGSSGDFDGDDKTAWNDLTVPLILNSQWSARSNRLNWFDNAGNPDRYGGTEIVTALISEPDDVVFTGVPVGEDNLLPWTTGPEDLLYVNIPSGGEVIAETAPGAGDNETGGAMLMVRFETGTEFYTGAVDKAAGPRTFFGFGSDDNTYFPLTPQGQQVYLREIYRMLTMD